MNHRTWRDRLHALGPTVLRWGVAAVLILDGLRRTGWAPRSLAEVAPGMNTARPAEMLSQVVAAATQDGVQFTAQWANLLGIAELAASGLLFIGLLTRWVALPVAGLSAYGLVAGFSQPGLPSDAPAMALLGAAALSLMVSGGGFLSLRRRGRVQPPFVPQPVFHERGTVDFVHARGPSVGTRIKNWFARLRPRRSAPPVIPVRPARKWGLWRFKTS